MDSSFYTRVGEGKYEVHFETGEKWKYALVEAACREAIDHAKPLMVTENAPRWVRCEDALPEIGQRVIVYDGWMQFMTRKDDQRLNGKMYWENEEGNRERVDDEAYWMPIEPPREGE